MKRKLLSMALTLCVLASAFVIMPTTVNATSKTADEAISWCESQLGKSLDYDNSWGAQCVDFIAYYYKFLGVTTPGGNGCDYATNSLPSGWTRTKGGTPQKGDILVYTGGYGHVAIFLNSTTSYNQNWSGQYVEKVGRSYTQSYTVTEDEKKVTKSYWGCIHPNFSNSTPTTPTTPTIPTGTQTVSDGDYHIVSALDNSFGLNVAYNSGEDRANVQLWDSMGDDDKTSVVNVSYLGSGFYSLTFKNSGKALDVAGSSSQPRTNVQQYTPNSASDAQKWIIKSAGNGYYYIISKCGGNYLDVLGGTAEKATNIQVYTGNSSTAQKWKFVPSGVYTGVTISDGEYHIVSALDNSLGISAADNSKEDGANVQLGNNMGDDDKTSVVSVQHIGSGIYTLEFKNSGKSLDVYGNLKDPRTNVQQYTYNSTEAQKWIIRYGGNGYYYIIGKGSGLSLDILGGSASVGTNIQVYTLNYSQAQKWKFIPSGVYTGQTVSDGDYHIVSSIDNSFGISAEKNSKENGANVQLGNNMNDTSSIISVKYIGSGFYTLIFKESGKSLDVYNNSRDPRTNVQQTTYNYTDAQKWIIRYGGNGYYYIIAKGSGLSLDLLGGSASAGTNIQIYTLNYSQAQKWKFVEVQTATTTTTSATTVTAPISTSSTTSTTTKPTTETTTSSTTVTTVSKSETTTSSTTVTTVPKTEVTTSSTIATTPKTEEYLVSKMMQNVVSTNSIGKIEAGKSYMDILSPADGYKLNSVSVATNGEILNVPFTDDSCVINIPKVSGDISIIAVAVKKAEPTTESTTITTKPVAKTTLSLSKSSANLYVKGTTSIKASVQNGIGATTYKTSNPKVVKVDSKGKVTALKAGTANITVTNNKVSKIFTVTVKNPKLNKSSISLKKGKTFTLKITGKIGSAKFTTSNKKIATVNSKGKIVAKKKGSATITVKTNGITLKCKVKVK